ncbi:hypothetical protein BgAZ_102170 [Babesia gibsoni]|uniref:CPW-WPC domain-containing protein n=1 Tax=Babesia gibsoni TaxID=33632 RepID=A0AAD8UST2_BABGI|nr:hypothetical protein BgAZ_102170 [Babesia gibsoni]
MLFMEDCNVKWPCKSSADKSDLSFCNNADRNFLQPCPENFLRHKQDSGYVCVPNFAGYMGPCNSIVSFENYSKESKMLWAQTCGTNWPCMTVCPFLFDKCPMDWVQAPDGACEAPASYKGPCEKRIHFTYYTQEMKRKKCIECDIPFECTSECNKDYDKCPVLWKSEEDGYCSPHSGSLNCVGLLIDIYKQAGNPQSEAKGASFYFGSLSQASKKLFESQCNTVEFPCMENDDDINWNLNCPVGWTISSEDLRSCQPPIINDDDVCKSQVAFNNEEDKRAFASLCQINWSAPLSTLVSKPVEKKLENDGPITDLGHLHAIDTTSGISSNHTKTIEKKDQKSPEQRGPKEKTVHIKAANTSLVSPYIVMSGSHKHRRPYKGFLREMHLLPGST